MKKDGHSKSDRLHPDSSSTLQTPTCRSTSKHRSSFLLFFVADGIAQVHVDAAQVWRGDAGYAEEAGGIFRIVWADERGADASRGWEQTVQGGPLVPPLPKKKTGKFFIDMSKKKGDVALPRFE